MRALFARLFRRHRGGIIPSRSPDDDSVLVMLSPGYHHIDDPDEAEALGMNVDAKRMRHGRNTRVRCDCCIYQR